MDKQVLAQELVKIAKNMVGGAGRIEQALNALQNFRFREAIQNMREAQKEAVDDFERVKCIKIIELIKKAHESSSEAEMAIHRLLLGMKI